MNLLVSLNLGDFTSDNVRRSHVAAAARWGAQYLEATAPIVRPYMDLFRQKLTLLPMLTFADHICWVDGDAIISEACPDLFRTQRKYGYLIGAVNIQPGQPEECDDFQAQTWDRLSRHAGAAVPEYNTEKYINVGLMVADSGTLARASAEALAIADRATAPMDLIDPMVEQTALNIAIARQCPKWGVMPPEYNRVAPEVWEPDRPMRHYVEHLARLGDGFRTNRRAIMDTIRWQEFAPHTAEEPVEEVVAA